MTNENVKKSISDAFYDLSIKKDIDKITVVDLVKACNISRQTFYYHFQDIFEVCEWGLKERMRQIMQMVLSADTSKEAIYVFFQELSKYYMYFYKLHYSNRREYLEAELFHQIQGIIQKALKKKRPDSDLRQSDLDFMLDFYSIGIAEYLVIHINEEIDAKFLSEKVYRMMNGELKLL